MCKPLLMLVTVFLHVLPGLVTVFLHVSPTRSAYACKDHNGSWKMDTTHRCAICCHARCIER